MWAEVGRRKRGREGGREGSSGSRGFIKYITKRDAGARGHTDYSRYYEQETWEGRPEETQAGSRMLTLTAPTVPASGFMKRNFLSRYYPIL